MKAAPMSTRHRLANRPWFDTERVRREFQATDHQDVPDGDPRPATCPECGDQILVCTVAKMAGQQYLKGFGDQIVLNASDYLPHGCAYPFPRRETCSQAARRAGEGTDTLFETAEAVT